MQPVSFPSKPSCGLGNLCRLRSGCCLWLLSVPDHRLTFGTGFLLILALAWRYMRPSYRIYALAITLLAFSYHTGPLYPYMGLPRHLLLAFPVFIGLGARLRHPAFALSSLR